MGEGWGWGQRKTRNTKELETARDLMVVARQFGFVMLTTSSLLE